MIKVDRDRSTFHISYHAIYQPHSREALQDMAPPHRFFGDLNRMEG